MPPRGVFRRPPVLRRRRFVPYGVAAAAAAGHVVIRRRLWRRSRRAIVRRARVVVATSSARGQTPILQRRLRRIARRVMRQRARLQARGFTQQTLQHVAPRRRPAQRRPRPLRRTTRPTIHGFTQPYVPAQQHVVVRLLKAVGRMRRAMHRRLFWRPPPEIIPAPERHVAVPKGRIFSPGLIRGRIYHPGD